MGLEPPASSWQENYPRCVKRPDFRHLPVREKTSPELNVSGKIAKMRSTNGNIAPMLVALSGGRRVGGEKSTDNGVASTVERSEFDEAKNMYPHLLGPVAAGVEIGVGESSAPGRFKLSDEAMPVSEPTRRSSYADSGGTMAKGDSDFDEEADAGKKPTCCGLDERITRWSIRFPLNKLKILVGVWQILAVFSSITGVEFPSSYAVFLSWINVFNFDLGYIVSASCVVPYLNFYQRLLATTLTPFALVAGLVWTYRMAKRRSGIGSAGEVARRAAWLRHVTAGLLLTFLVSTYDSTRTSNKTEDPGSTQERQRTSTCRMGTLYRSCTLTHEMLSRGRFGRAEPKRMASTYCVAKGIGSL